MLYVANDGGLYVFNEITEEWKNLSTGLDITMYYDVAVSQKDSIMLVAGSQDNGTKYKNNQSEWKLLNNADGIYSFINPLNENIQYTSTQNGALYRTKDGWETQTPIWPPGVFGAFETPFLIDQNDAQTIYAAYGEVYKSVDEGNTWSIISNLAPALSSAKLTLLAVSKTDSKVIYTGNKYYGQFFFTNNGGATWSGFSEPNHGPNQYTNIKVDPNDANRIFVTKSGYLTNDKIYVSDNNGTSWLNISYDLPNVPVFCVLLDEKSDPTNLDIYVGTTIGVFHKRDKDISWEYVGIGLPNTRVTDLEIRHNFHILTAATYGRGIWELDISAINTSTAVTQPSKYQNKITLVNSLAQGSLLFHSSLEFQANLNFTVFDLNGSSIFQSLNNSMIADADFKLCLPPLPSGGYIITVSSPSIFESFKFVMN